MQAHVTGLRPLEQSDVDWPLLAESARLRQLFARGISGRCLVAVPAAASSTSRSAAQQRSQPK